MLRSRRLRDVLRRYGQRLSPQRLPSARKVAGRSLFFAPAIVLIVVFVAAPVVSTIGLSFISETTGAFPSVENYEDVLSSSDTINFGRFPGRTPPWGTLIHNALWIAIHLPVTLFTGLALALVLRDARGGGITKSLVFIGIVTPMIVGGVILRFLYEGGVGIVPAFFGLIGIEGLNRNWMTYTPTLLFGMIFGSVWMWTGFALIIYSAGLTTIPKEYFESARIDGASFFRIFVRITWPLLKPMTLVIITLTVLWELKLFDIVFAAVGAGGGVGKAGDVLALQMYRLAFVDLRFESAAVVATLLTVLTLVATAWMIKRLVTR